MQWKDLCNMTGVIDQIDDQSDRSKTSRLAIPPGKRYLREYQSNVYLCQHQKILDSKRRMDFETNEERCKLELERMARTEEDDPSV